MNKATIHIIAGAKGQEKAQRAQQVPGRSFIDYTGMTAGETRLSLLADRMAIYMNYYPEVKEFRKAHDMLVNALYRGVHRMPSPSSLQWSQSEQAAAKAIRTAKWKTRPAGRNLQLRNRKSAGHGIGDPLVPLLDCEALNPFPTGDPTGSGYDPNTGPFDPGSSGGSGGNTQQYYDCIQENVQRNILNQHLEESSFHLLYEYLSVAQANESPVAAIKRNKHRQAVQIIHEITGLDRSLINEWLRTGIIRSMVNQGENPTEPESCIESIRVNGRNGGAVVDYSSIGVDPMTVIVIIGAIIEILRNVVNLFVNLKNGVNQTPEHTFKWSELPDAGTPDFNADGEDWFGIDEIIQDAATGATTLFASPSSLLLLGGGFLLLNNQSK